ncbi:hypothetical protein POM88_009184 [Heracleum sosnowskyi]|uniref:NAC domain-containing protein n=1 Tax=Heracleum sosnowskyi TaxID=360622 RepID=A0AAD8J8Y6_9APIA|nr:hypothetical protein POM88_009184 [Heracleum sosnowskyi]
MAIDLPPGYRFYPNDEELLSFFLKPKVNGETLPCVVILEKQIYGGSANPWEVFDDSSTLWIICGGSGDDQTLTPEEVQFLMDDSEDFKNLGIKEFSNFGGWDMDVTSFDLKSFFKKKSVL